MARVWFVPAILLALHAAARAEENKAPAAAETPAATEMQKWIATHDAQWQAAFKRDVTDLHEAELARLQQQYRASLEAAINKASAASDLTGAVALRDEQKRFGETKVLPEQDDAGANAGVKQLRLAMRAQLAKVEKDHAARAQALHARYDQALAQTQSQLTQARRLDDALLVKAQRDQVAAAWLAGLPAPAPPVAPVKAAGPGEEKKPLGATPATPAETNLFTNANFENGLEGWSMVAFQKKGTMSIDTQELHEGNPTLRIDNTVPDFTFVRQLVGKPNTKYRLSGYIKTRKVEPEKKGAKDGACLQIGWTAGVQNANTAPIQKTQSWTKVTLEFTTTSSAEIRVGAGLTGTGTAWFSKLSLIEVGAKKK